MNRPRSRIRTLHRTPSPPVHRFPRFGTPIWMLCLAVGSTSPTQQARSPSGASTDRENKPILERGRQGAGTSVDVLAARRPALPLHGNASHLAVERQLRQRKDMSTNSPFEFNHVVSPMPIEQFMTKHFEQEPLLLRRRNPDHYR